MKHVAQLTALSLSALALAASGTALAGTGENPAQPAGPAAAAGTAGQAPAALPALPAGLPKQYESLQSSLLAAPAGQQIRGSLACSTGKVPLGGGVLISSSDVGVNVNSSFPNGSTWIADVNNASGAATTFRVFVICARAPRKYQIVETPDVTAVAGSQAQALATCPAGTVPYGGGGLSRSGETSVNLNSTFPTGSGWRADMNDASSTSTTFSAFAICGKKLSGYQVVAGANQDVPAGLSVGSQAVCPGASLPLGGGIVIFSNDVHANINSTFPASGDAWSAFASNGSAFSTPMSARIVCAGV